MELPKLYKYICYVLFAELLLFYSDSLFLQPGSSIPKVSLCIVKVENTTTTPQKWIVKPPSTLDGMYVQTFIFVYHAKLCTEHLYFCFVLGSIISYQPNGWAKIILMWVLCG